MTEIKAERRTLNSAEDYTDSFYVELAALIQRPESDTVATERIHDYYQQTASLYDRNGWTEFPGWSVDTRKSSAPSDDPSSATSADPFQRVKASGKNPVAPVKKTAGVINAPPSMQRQVSDEPRKLKVKCKVCGGSESSSTNEDGEWGIMNTCSVCRDPFHVKCHPDAAQSPTTCSECLEKVTEVKTSGKIRPSVINLTDSDDGEPSAKQRKIGGDSVTPTACTICKTLTVGIGNTLLQCSECSQLIHQECHDPVISSAQKNDPRFIFVCMLCVGARKQDRFHSPQPRSMASDSPTTQKTTSTVVVALQPVVTPDSNKKDLSAPVVASIAAEFLAKHKTGTKKTSSSSTGSNSGSSKSDTKTGSLGSGMGLSKLAAQHQARQNASPSSAKSGASSSKQSGSGSNGGKIDNAFTPASTQLQDAQKRLMAMKKKATASRQGNRF